LIGAEEELMWRHAPAATVHIRKMPRRLLLYSTVIAAMLFCLTSQVTGKRAAVSACATGEDSESDRINVSFNLENRRMSPFPSDVFTADDPTQLTGRRVALPLQDCDERPNDCEDFAVINTLDGFSGSPRVSIPFTGMVELATVNNSTVFLLRLGDAMSREDSDPVGVERVGGNHWTWDTPACTPHFQVDGLLDQHMRYAVVVTSGVRDESGRPVRSPASIDFVVM
jgi:hypothetical protein